MNIQIMKKINIVFAAFALIAAMAACDKEETQGLEKVRINVSVSDFDPSTRALKSGWENGDIINVYLDDVVSHTPDFTLTYGESGWTASELTSDAVSRLNESGTLKGFWESSNSAVTGTGWNKWMSGTKYAYFDYPGLDKASTTGVQTYVTAQFGNLPYKYEEGTLSAEINKWNITTNFQLVVTGLSEGSYSLYTGKNNANVNLNVCSRICIDSGRVDVSMSGPSSDENMMAGITNADGVAFLGYVTRANVNFDYVFYLVDNTEGKKYSFTKTTSLPTNTTKVLGAKVPFSSFTVVTP